jgi:hypothetical protein
MLALTPLHHQVDKLYCCGRAIVVVCEHVGSGHSVTVITRIMRASLERP